jgi:DNA-binding response OmpR family regulator
MTIMTNAAHAAIQATKPRILICDDDIDYASELMEALEARNFMATSLLTISAARAAILSPSILLLDLCMPERSGLDIAKILASHERKDYFKIILVSGCSDYIIKSVAAQFESRGLCVLGTFQKPVDLDRLCALLKAA